MFSARKWNQVLVGEAVPFRWTVSLWGGDFETSTVNFIPQAPSSPLKCWRPISQCPIISCPHGHGLILLKLGSGLWTGSQVSWVLTPTHSQHLSSSLVSLQLCFLPPINVLWDKVHTEPNNAGPCHILASLGPLNVAFISRLPHQHPSFF